MCKKCVFTLTLLLLVEYGYCEKFDESVAQIFRSFNCQNSLYFYEAPYDITAILHLNNCSYYVLESMVNLSTVCDVAFFSFERGNKAYNYVEDVVEYLSADATCLILFYGDDVENIFWIFSIYKIYNVVLVTELLDIYTYRPISSGNIRPYYLGKYGDVIDYRTETDLPYFPRCEMVIIATYKEPFVNDAAYESNSGFEVVLSKILASYLQVEPYFECKGCLESPKRIGTCSHQLQIGGRDLSTDVPIYYNVQEEVAWFLPLAKPKEAWMNMLLVFNDDLWCMLLVSFVLLILMCYLVKYRRIDVAILFVYSVMLNAGVKVPKKLALIYTTWVFACIVLSNYYGGFLVSFMTKSVYDKQISAVDELIRQGYEFGSYYVEENYTHFEKNLTKCSGNAINCYERALNNKFAFYHHSRTVMYRLSFNKSQRLYKLPSKDSRYLAFEMKRRSPYLKRTMKGMAILDEAGIVNKLDQYGWKFRKEPQDSDYEVITVHHIRFIVFLFAVGVSTALLTFLFELCYTW